MYDGESDFDKIKAEFFALTGENYDGLFALDLPNSVGNNQGTGNPCKHMLYSDPFNGFLDRTVKDGVEKEYEKHEKTLLNYTKTSKYSYLFECAATLCKLMCIKYALGARTRNAYQTADKKTLSNLVKDYKRCEKLLEKFYLAYRKVWYKENKPQGFDIHDLRLGGVARRLRSCRERLQDYVLGKVKNIPELEEKLLDFYGNGENFEKEKTPTYNTWINNASVNVM